MTEQTREEIEEEFEAIMQRLNDELNPSWVKYESEWAAAWSERRRKLAGLKREVER